jgi:hypothetical protein
MSRHFVLLILALTFASAPVQAVKLFLYADTQCNTLETAPSWPGPNPISGPLQSCIKSGRPDEPIHIQFHTCNSTGVTYANYINSPNCSTPYGYPSISMGPIDVCVSEGTGSFKLECSDSSSAPPVTSSTPRVTPSASPVTSSASALSSCRCPHRYLLALLVAVVAVLL